MTNPDLVLSGAGCPESEYDSDFLQGMIDRMAVSYHKYGKAKFARQNGVKPLESLQRRLEKYAETGNTEWLIDAANFAMIEFMDPGHPEAHFRPTDSDESPGRETAVGASAAANRDLLTSGRRGRAGD